MTTAEAWDLILKAAGIFGGIGVIAVGVAGFMAKFVADKSIEKHKATLGQETERLKSELAQETETHKLRLKKQEINYNKQLDAVSEFIELHQNIMPRYSYPGKNWYDVREEVIEEFSRSEGKLEAYRRKFAAVLDADAKKLLKECIALASHNKFAGMPEGEVGEKEAEEAVDKFLDTLSKLEERLLEQVRN
jgi:hypothetical protein